MVYPSLRLFLSTNCADPDEGPQPVAFHLVLQCLQNNPLGFQKIDAPHKGVEMSKLSTCPGTSK